MKAMILKEFGGVGNFELQQVEDPVAGDNEVLIAIKAIGIDPIDVKTRKGEGMADYLRKEHPMILGWDMSGIVWSTGKDVKDFKEGDKVFGTVNFPGPGSSYAELAAAPADQLALIPTNIGFVEAAAATQSPLTAWQALMDTGKIESGQRVLIHGGAGGVGSFAVQIAHRAGCYVITTASGADADFVRSLGADEVIDYKTQRFEDIAGYVDFILDTVGGENFIRSLNILKPDGTIVLLPSDKEEEAGKVAKERNVKNYVHILMHSSGRDMRRISGMLEDGSMKVYVGREYPFEQIPLAHSQIEKGEVKGKVVIKI